MDSTSSPSCRSRFKKYSTSDGAAAHRSRRHALHRARAASTRGVRACVGLAPSPPATQVDRRVPLRTGEFGPEEYGLVSTDVEHQPAMPDLDREERRLALDSLGRESRLARDERQAGVVVPALP